MRVQFLALAMAALVAAGCAQRSSSAGDGRPASSARARAPRNTITSEEIARTPPGSAYDVIRRLRPEFFSGRGETSLASRSRPLPEVLIDGVQRGDLELLRQLPSESIRWVRLYRASEVPPKYSSSFVSGLIEVTTK